MTQRIENEKVTYAEIAKKLGINRHKVSEICRRFLLILKLRIEKD